MGDQEHPLTKFSESEAQWATAVPSQPDPSYGVADQSEVQIKDFFARPVRIYTAGWAIGETLSLTINPWEIWMSNAHVGNRIANYSFMRGTLKMKFVVNGNPFYYGRTLIAYQPLSGYDTITPNDPVAPDEADLVFWTQHPHIFVDPTSSQAGEIHAPFLYSENGLSITEDHVEWRNMGAIHFRGLTPLSHANGGTDELDITVFAWMDDIVLSVPTGVNPAILNPQSGECDPQGQISRPATAVAAAANALSDAPYIGPYAKASSMVATGVASVAQAFGYSKPVIQEPAMVVKPQVMGSLAPYNDVDTATPLAGDKKQELCVDTRTMGLSGTDELDIKHIASHLSYIGQFNWSSASNHGVLLGSVGVTPSQRMEAADGGYTLSSTAFCAMPFEYWRGSLKFRFQIVASNYHRGRLQVAWDPDSALITGFNLRYNRIIDIAEERDFTIDVGWGSRHAWLRTDKILEDSIPFEAAGQYIIDSTRHNGILVLRVLNGLAEPSSGIDSVKINVFVSGGDDLEFAVPSLARNTNKLTPFVEEEQLAPQSGDIEDDDANDPEQSEQESILTNIPVGTASDVFFGDPVVSFRSLLKRYCRVDALDMGGTLSIFQLTVPFRPFTPGADPHGKDVVSTLPYNIVNQSYFSYVALAFVAFRGSMRWKAMLPIAGTVPQGMFSVENVAESDDISKLGLLSFPTTDLFTRMRDAGDGSAGSAATSAHVNNVLESAIPYYSHLRFIHTKNPSVLDSDSQAMEERAHRYTVHNNNNIVESFIIRYHACGDDATFGFYTGLPRMYQIKV